MFIMAQNRPVRSAPWLATHTTAHIARSTHAPQQTQFTTKQGLTRDYVSRRYMMHHYHLWSRWLYCAECPQYSFRLEAPGYLCASCLLPAFDAASVTWLNSRSSLVACNWLLSALSVVLSTLVWRRRKFGEVSCAECTGHGNDYELIPTVKMETTPWAIKSE